MTATRADDSSPPPPSSSSGWPSRTTMSPGLPPIATKAWWHRNLDPDERRRVMDELAITRVDYWIWRFTIMLTLSLVVAVMGMSANSAAVVIGAMLIAPLMTPVLAAAACLSLTLVRKSLWSLLKVALATVWCIGVAYVLSRFVFSSGGSLPSEVEARTKPDIRDLFVALAAGTAGAYATVRKDVSSSLPGVAVAVALVPPVATVGITLEAGKLDLAAGALLLYVTNLAAIVFAGVMVFIATGFVPPRRLTNTAVQLVVGFLVALAVVVVVAVPLYNRSVAIIDAAEDEVLASSIVDNWVAGSSLTHEVDVQDGRVLVRLSGFEAPPDDAALTQSLQEAFGEVQVLVEWVRTERATTTTSLVVEPTDDELLLMEIEPIVQGWLDEGASTEGSSGADVELRQLTVTDGGVRLDLAGSGEPPSVGDLTDRISEALGTQLSVRLYWTEQETITPESEASPEELIEADMRVRADAWAASTGVTIDQLSYDQEQERVRLYLSGLTEPDINEIVVDLRDAVGSSVPVDVFFTQQQRLTTTTVALADLFAPGIGLPITTTSTTPSQGTGNAATSTTTTSTTTGP